MHFFRNWPITQLPLLVLLAAPTAMALQAAEPVVVVDVQRGADATADYSFSTVAAPSATDAGNHGEARLLQGSVDPNGASLAALFDGQTARQSDDPRRNFFLAARDQGRILIDLGTSIEIQQFNTYSWHPASRGAQVYSLYGAKDQQADLQLEPQGDVDLAAAGWVKIADVDTRSNDRTQGGQFGVSIQKNDGGRLGRFRYLLMDIHPTDADRIHSQTFYSEIDIIDGNEYPLPQRYSQIDSILVEDRYEIFFDTSEVPELRDWVDTTLKPICRKWYPRIVALLPSEGYQAPQQFTIYFHKDMDGVANTSGTRINCAGLWFLDNLQGEAAGAVVHELVHVVQRYRVRRGGAPNPGWLVEGVADYIRWFLYEPPDQRPRPDPRRANYDDSYRMSAAFLNFVTEEYDPALVPKLNAAMLEGRYSEQLWVTYTEKTPEQLWAEYVETL